METKPISDECFNAKRALISELYRLRFSGRTSLYTHLGCVVAAKPNKNHNRSIGAIGKKNCKMTKPGGQPETEVSVNPRESLYSKHFETNRLSLKVARTMPTTIGLTQHLLRLACPLLVFLVAAASLHAQGKPVLSPSKAVDQTTETRTLTPQEVYEIRNLKAVLGGVRESLKGVVPGGDPDQQFLDSLEKIEFTLPEKTATVSLLPAPTRPLGRPAKSVNQAALRASAKKLEDLAAELEQVRFYDQADELRGIAAKYWLQARSMD